MSTARDLALQVLVAEDLKEHGPVTALRNLFQHGVTDGERAVGYLLQAGIDPIDLEAAMLPFEAGVTS